MIENILTALVLVVIFVVALILFAATLILAGLCVAWLHGWYENKTGDFTIERRKP